MAKFKKGDLVKCIDNEYMEHLLVLNQLYIVSNIINGTVILQNEPTHFFAGRFKLVSRTELSKLLFQQESK